MGEALYNVFDGYMQLVYEFYSSLDIAKDNRRGIGQQTVNFSLQNKNWEVTSKTCKAWLECDSDASMELLSVIPSSMFQGYLCLLTLL